MRPLIGVTTVDIGLALVFALVFRSASSSSQLTLVPVLTRSALGNPSPALALVT